MENLRTTGTKSGKSRQEWKIFAPREPKVEKVDKNGKSSHHGNQKWKKSTRMENLRTTGTKSGKSRQEWKIFAPREPKVEKVPCCIRLSNCVTARRYEVRRKNPKCPTGIEYFSNMLWCSTGPCNRY